MFSIANQTIAMEEFDTHRTSFEGIIKAHKLAIGVQVRERIAVSHVTAMCSTWAWPMWNT